MSLSIATLGPLSFLLVAIVDDLLFKKFHNWLFLSLLGASFLYTATLSPLNGVEAGLGLLTGLALMLPLVLCKALGAGDMKFLMCLGVLLGSFATLHVFVYSLFWGALIGVSKALFAGQLSKFKSNLETMSYRLSPQELHTIPYTVAFFLGWLTWIQMGALI